MSMPILPVFANSAAASIAKFTLFADRFEMLDPDWVDENYFQESTILTAVVARMIHHNSAVRTQIDASTVEQLNSLFSDVQTMASEQTIRHVVNGFTIVIFRRPDQGIQWFELVQYKF